MPSDLWKRVPPLCGEADYKPWKAMVMSLLIVERLGGHIDGTKVKPEVGTDDWHEWEVHDAQAKIYIYGSLGQKTKSMVDMGKTAKDIWDYLRDTNAMSESTAIDHYWRKWITMRYDGKTELSTFILAFDTAL